MLDVVQPDVGAQLQASKKWRALCWDLASFVAMQLSTGSVEQPQVIIEAHRQAAFIARAAAGQFLADSLSRWFQCDRANQPAFSPCSVRRS